VWGRDEMYSEFLSGNFRGRDHLEDIGIDGENFKMNKLFSGILL
jgi:hypothetical protein